MDRDTIGAARGIGITLVVFAHIVPGAGPLLLPYIFHMPLFFFLSGLTLPTGRPILHTLGKDLWRIVGFYLVALTILLLLSMVLQPLGVSARHTSPYNWKTYFVFPFTRNSHHVELFLVGWFLVALFFARYVALTVLAIGRCIGQPFLFAAIAAACIGWVGMSQLAPRFQPGQWYWNLSSQVCVATMYCIFGALARRAPIAWPANALWPSAIAYLVMVWSGVQPLVMSWSRYPSGYALHVVGTMLGITVVLLAAHFLRTSSALQLIGRHTKAIMTWHLASFALLNLWYVRAAGFAQTGMLDVYMPARNWPVYTAAGIVLPLALALLWETVIVGQMRARWRRPASGKRQRPVQQ